jgi:hypothetical protein
MHCNDARKVYLGTPTARWGGREVGRLVGWLVGRSVGRSVGVGWALALNRVADLDKQRRQAEAIVAGARKLQNFEILYERVCAPRGATPGGLIGCVVERMSHLRLR